MERGGEESAKEQFRSFELVRQLWDTWEQEPRKQSRRLADRGTAGGRTGGRICGRSMKLLSSWRARLPAGPWSGAWPWAQQPRSRWALGGWAGAAQRGAEPGTLGPILTG